MICCCWEPRAVAKGCLRSPAELQPPSPLPQQHRSDGPFPRERAHFAGISTRSMTTTSLTLRYRRPGENLREASCVRAAARRLWDVSSHDCRSRAHLIRLVAKLLCTNRSLTRMRFKSRYVSPLNRPYRLRAAARTALARTELSGCLRSHSIISVSRGLEVNQAGQLPRIQHVGATTMRGFATRVPKAVKFESCGLRRTL